MWDAIIGWAGWGTAGAAAAWIVTSCLLASGLVACFIPALPAHLIILIAAIGHRLMLGREGSGMQWWSFLILIALMVASQAFEFFSGAAGTKWFGGTKWGGLGAFVGSLVGMFLMPWGLLLGPLIGAFAFEMAFAKKTVKPATVSGVGSVVGTVAGLAMKVAVGVVMTAWFLLDAIWIGR